VPFPIKVIDSDDVNAFALPGGCLLRQLRANSCSDSEAELAGVMTHEIGHVAACHSARQRTRANLMQIMTVPLVFVGGPAGYGVHEDALAVPLTFLHFSREFEAQADYLGVHYISRAGYDPEAFISFFEKLQSQEKRTTGTISKAFATHPQTPDRIARSQEESAKILSPNSEYKITTSEFEAVKARFSALEKTRQMIEEQDGNKPRLRRHGKRLRQAPHQSRSRSSIRFHSSKRPR
jgi:predicted Zn-dependent protease